MTSRTTHSDKKEFLSEEIEGMDNNKYLTDTEVNTAKSCNVHNDTTRS